MLKSIYDKTLKLAAHKSANFYLSIVSFIESSFFPIPPDVMIVPMSLAKKEEYLKIYRQEEVNNWDSIFSLLKKDLVASLENSKHNIN